MIMAISRLIHVPGVPPNPYSCSLSKNKRAKAVVTRSLTMTSLHQTQQPRQPAWMSTMRTHSKLQPWSITSPTSPRLVQPRSLEPDLQIHPPHTHPHPGCLISVLRSFVLHTCLSLSLSVYHSVRRIQYLLHCNHMIATNGTCLADASEL